MSETASSIPERIVETIIASLLLPALALAAPLLWLLGRAYRFPTLLFWQDRVGLRGQRLRVLKFRTMLDGTDEADCPAILRLVRRTGIDELPQILLVLSGRMALFGPRPLLMRDLFPEGVSVDQRLWSAIRERQSVRPGITGICQLLDRRRSRRGRAYWRMLDADLWYIRHRSLGVDALLLVMTPLYAITAGAVCFPFRSLLPERAWCFSGFGAPETPHYR